jgi:hypothetical protein
MGKKNGEKMKSRNGKLLTKETRESPPEVRGASEQIVRENGF